jgi:hypothetical protein
MPSSHLLPTTVVGSYPQPDWLVNREMLSKTVPRVRMDIWRVPEQWLEQAQDDATIVPAARLPFMQVQVIFLLPDRAANLRPEPWSLATLPAAESGWWPCCAMAEPSV